MKTLDEVLEAKTYEVGLNSKADCWEVPIDLYGVIIHYLHEYRDAKNTLDVERKNSIEAYCQWRDAKEKLEAQTSQTMWVDKHFQFEISDNPPLTWDELKAMIGKPIWVEMDDIKFWTVVDDFRTICNQECLCCSKGYMCRSTHTRGDWQAFRKERK